MRRLSVLARFGAAGLLIGGLAVVLSLAQAADHLDSPRIATDGRLDINDLYVFQSPQNAANTVLIMTVNPFAGAISMTTLHPTGRYDFPIDHNADAIEDLTLRLTFGAVGVGGVQNVTLRRITPANLRGTIIATGPTGQDIAITGGGTLRVGTFDDPFFFALATFNSQFRNPGSANFGTQAAFPNPGVNFFNGNTTGIIIEIPSVNIRGVSNSIGVWTRTELNGRQFDRTAFPVVNTVAVPPALVPASADPRGNFKDVFNSGLPRNDRTSFLATAGQTLTGPIGTNASPYALTGAQATALGNFLLPDIMPFNTTSAAGFPNGRRLADDVGDVVLALGTGLNLDGTGTPRVTTDNVANDSNFTNTFPYLAPPNLLP